MASSKDGPPLNLRDYLLRIKKIESKVDASFVLAEGAQTLYRDTSYSDLINFEEDIARISGNVLVISESAGSLAELGAFSANETIRHALRILISEDNFNQESFVRFGPVERVRNNFPERVGVFPWREHKKGGLVRKSVDPVFVDIKKFIAEQIGLIPKSELYSNLGEAKIFYDIFWISHIANVISPTTLYESVRRMHPNATNDDIRNKIFCMKVAGWMDKISYSNKEYYFCKIDMDPFEYSFVPGVVSRDSIRRKGDLRTFFKGLDEPPRAAYERANKARGAGV